MSLNKKKRIESTDLDLNDNLKKVMLNIFGLVDHTVSYQIGYKAGYEAAQKEYHLQALENLLESIPEEFLPRC